MKVDPDGSIVGDSAWESNPAIHGAAPQARAIMQTTATKILNLSIAAAGPALLAILFFLAQIDSVALFADDIANLQPEFQFPLPVYGHWIASRVFYAFFGGMFFEFFFTNIRPFISVNHFVDVHSVYATSLWTMAGLGMIVISFFYAKLFVRIKIYLFVPFGLCFYVLFLRHIPYHSAAITVAYYLPYVMALFFLYPIFTFVVHGRNVFASWTDELSVSAMFVFAYVNYFSNFFSISFISISIFVMVSYYIGRNYIMDGIRSPRSILAAAKLEPRWFIAIIFSAPILMAINFYFALTSGRWARVVEVSNALPGLDQSFVVWDYGNIITALIVVIVFLGFSAKLRARFLRNGTKSEKSKFFVALLLASLALLLFQFVTILLTLSARFPYFEPLHPFVRFVLATSVLGTCFQLLNIKAFAPFSVLLIFVLSFHALHHLTLGNEQGPPMRKVEMREAVSLMYTFRCYGAKSIPFYDGELLGFPNLPTADDAKWFQNYWDARLTRYIGAYRKPGDRSAHFYHEPSIKSINLQLAGLQSSGRWLCAGRADNPHYIESIK